MKKKKNIIEKVLKIFWFSFGGLIFLWTIFFYIKMHSINTLGVIAAALLFAAGVYALVLFAIITFLYYLIKGIVRWIKRKSSKQGKLRKK